MSRALILFILTLPFMAHGQSLPIGSSLVSNGDFESGYGTWNVDWGAGPSLNTATPLAGASSLRLTTAKGGRAQVISGVEAGATYRISGLAKLALAGDVASIGINFVNSAGTVVLAQWIQVLSTSVQNYSYDVVAPSGITTVQLYPYKNVGVQAADFDNISMVKIADP